MREEDLEKMVCEHYASISMSESKMAHILKNTPQTDVVVPFYRKVWFSYAAAACIALMIVSVVVGNLTSRVQQGTQVELANQVINVHDGHFDPDIVSGDLRSIQTGLGHSDFSIIPTNNRAIQDYTVKGGRRCGFKGLKAIHVVLVNQRTQKECCLYVLPDAASLRDMKDALVNVDDHKVSLWHDNGRVFALYDPS